MLSGPEYLIFDVFDTGSLLILLFFFFWVCIAELDSSYGSANDSNRRTTDDALLFVVDVV